MYCIILLPMLMVLMMMALRWCLDRLLIRFGARWGISGPGDIAALPLALATGLVLLPLAAALLFHGNTMNFYTGMLRFLPPVLTQLGIACLAFNRRGHDVITTRASRAAEGGAFQTTAQAIEDNRLAAQWLAAKGFPAPVVMGHSNGGMLATRHVVDHPQTPALVLLSAGRGGRTSMQASGDRDPVGRWDLDSRSSECDRTRST